jgi:hypothetical protein
VSTVQVPEPDSLFAALRRALHEMIRELSVAAATSTRLPGNFRLRLGLSESRMLTFQHEFSNGRGRRTGEPKSFLVGWRRPVDTIHELDGVTLTTSKSSRTSREERPALRIGHDHAPPTIHTADHPHRPRS